MDFAYTKEHVDEALEHITERAADLDFALLDCLMAHASGQDVCKYLRTLRPQTMPSFRGRHRLGKYVLELSICGKRQTLVL